MVHRRNSTRINTFTLTQDLVERVSGDDTLIVANLHGKAIALDIYQVWLAWEQATPKSATNGTLVRVAKFPWAS